MLESVRDQTYSNWELCVADASYGNKIRETLTAYSRQDCRCRVIRIYGNLGDSKNTNEALKTAQGEFLVLLDHDGMLAPNCLFEVVALLNQKPDTDICYFDEDLLSDDGRRRHSPFFKPGWSPEMLCSVNYLTHAVVRRDLAEHVGPLDADCDGAQHWDFMLRCTRQTDRIERIPRILSHRRQECGRELEPSAAQARARALRKYFAGIGIANATVTHLQNGAIRSTWPTQNRKVSIIIPTKDKVHFLRRCLTSVFERTTYKNFEVLIVDTGSVENSTLSYYEDLRTDPRVRFIKYTGRFNYSKANNVAARQADGDFLLFLNNDTEALVDDWLEDLVRWAERPGIGAVGARLLYPDGTLQHAGAILGMQDFVANVFSGTDPDHSGIFGSVLWYRNYLAIIGACTMMPRQVFEEVGGFSEHYELQFSDTELCVRAAERGYRIVYTPFALLRHYDGQTRDSRIPPADDCQAFADFRDWIDAGDPYFNPNLSYLSCVPTVRSKDEPTPQVQLGARMRNMGLTSSPAKTA
jgi:GT2 family glycosyltransferase